MMIGLIDAYYHDGQPDSYQLAYWPMCKKFLQEYFPEEEIHLYRIAEGQRPSKPDECDLWIVSGSAKSCYESDEWILWLKEFIHLSNEQKAKMVGFCFGHQIIAEALGGRVEVAPQGWGIGIREISLDSQTPWGEKQSVVKLLFSHKDQVMRLPQSARAIASSDFCKYEMYQIGENILSFQGHPEFTKEFAKSRYLSRIAQIGEQQVKQTLTDMEEGEPDTALLWQWIHDFYKN